MRTYNAEYQANLETPSKDPRFTIRIDFADDFSDPVYVLSHSDSAYPSTSPQSTVISSRIISGSVVSQELKPISTIGNISFTCLDNGDSLTDLLHTKLTADKGIRLKRVRVYKGFRHLAWSEYELHSTQVIGNLKYKDGVYTVSCDDVQRLEKNKKLFVPKKTNLAQSLTSTDTTKIYVYDNTDFQTTLQGTSYSDGPSGSYFYVKIDDEVIRCSGTGNDGQDYLTIDARARFNTLAADHNISATSPQTGASGQPEVKEYIYIEMPVVKLLYAILLGAIYGSSPESTFPDHWHLGIDTEYLNNTDFSGIGSDMWDTSDDTKGIQGRFIGLESIEGKKFIEEELLPLIGCWMPVYADGSLGLQRRPAIISDSPFDIELNDSVISSYSDLNYRFNDIANQIIVYWNWSEYRQAFTRTTEVIYSDSITKHKSTDKKEIKLRGLHASKYSAEMVADTIDMLADRFVYPQWEIELTLMPTMEVLQNGDVVKINTDKIKDFTQSPHKLNRSFETVKTKTDLLTGVVTASFRCSSENIQPYTSYSDTTVLPDAWYTSQGGTNCTGLTGYSAGALTSSITLTGGSTPTVYYHDGDLTINAGVTITITNNVALYVKGELIVNGTIDGAENGLTGITGTYTRQSPAQEYASGLGFSASGGGFNDVYQGATLQRICDPLTGATSGDTRSIRNYRSRLIQYDGTSISGIGFDIRGVGGPAGTGIIGDNATSPPTPANQALGANGGNGGAGLVVVSRGVSFGASGAIDVSGGNGGQGNTWDYFVSGDGGPGMPGGVIFALDGSGATIPDLDKITQNSGVGYLSGTHFMTIAFNGRYSNGYWYPNTKTLKNSQPVSNYSLNANPGIYSQISYKNALTKIVYLKNQVAATEDPAEEKPTAPTSLNITSDETVLLTLQDGTQIVRAYLSWTASTDRQVDGYYVYYKKSADTYYKRYGDEIISRSDAEAYIGPLEQGVNYDFRVTAINIFGNESEYLTQSSHSVVGKSSNPNVPTSVTLTVVTSGLLIQGTAPADKDLAGISIESSDNTSPLSFTEIHRLSAVPSGKWAYTDNLAQGETRYYRVRAYDTSGLTSTYVNTTPTNATSTAPDQNADVTGEKYNEQLTDNLVIDGDAELTGADFWTNDSASSPSTQPTKSSSIVRYGAQSLALLQVSGVERIYNVKKFGTSYPADTIKIPVDIGEKVYLSCYVYQTAANTLLLKAQFYKADESVRGAITIDSTTSTGSWVELSGSYTVSDTLARYVGISIQQSGFSLNDIYIDSIRLRKTETGSTKNNLFVQTGTPTATGEGDLWYSSSTKLLKKWNGSTWETIGNDYTETDLDALLLNNGPTDAGATSNTFFHSASAPTANGLGDLWYDTTTGELYRWSNSTSPYSWVIYSDVTGKHPYETIRDNYLIDSDCELNNTDYWYSDSGSGALKTATSPNIAYSGSRSVYFTTSVPTTNLFCVTKGGTSSSDQIFMEVQEGETVYIGAAIKNSTSGNAKLYIFWYDGVKGFDSSTLIQTVTGTSWEIASGSAVTPAGVRYATFRIQQESAVTTYVDKVYLRLTEPGSDNTQNAFVSGIDAALTAVQLDGLDAYNNDKVYYHEYWNTLDGYIKTSNCTIPSTPGGYLQIYSQASNTERCRRVLQSTLEDLSEYSFNNTVAFKMRIKLVNTSPFDQFTNKYFFVGVMDDTTYGGTGAYIRIGNLNTSSGNVMYAECYNPSTSPTTTTLNLSTSWTANQKIEFIKSGSTVEFFVDDVSKGTISTSVPTGQLNTPIDCYATATGAASADYFYIYETKVFIG